jgi:F-type H+-transporting ATPase subunit a
MLLKPLIAAGGHFSLFTLMGMNHKYVHVAMGAFVTFVLLYLAVRIHRAYTDGTETLVPDSRFSLRNIIEILVEGVYNFLHDVLGDQTARFFPLLATVFIFILAGNLMGTFAGLEAPTSNINANFAVAIIMFFAYNYYGIQEHGPSYIKQFMGPVALLAPFMILVEIISHLVRPVSLSLRLFGNINGDHLALAVFSDLVPLFVPMIFMGLGMFVAFLQAFIFTILSAIYIQMAISHDH